MTGPTLTFSSVSPVDLAVDVLILAAARGEDGPRLLAPDAYSSLASGLSALGISGAAGEFVRIPDTVGAASAIAIVGLGTSVDAAAVRSAAGAATRQLVGVASVAFAWELDDAALVSALAEGAALGAYAFSAYRGATLAARKAPVEAITVHSAREVGACDAERVVAAVDAVNLVRDLVNTPPNDLYPESFAERATQESSGLPLEVEILDEVALADGGYGGILGVGQGSVRPPRLVKVSYSPGSATQHLALVGKGITFDTGGLSLKPMVSMIGMKTDMAGAATVLAVTIAAARLALPLRITAWLCLAENMPSGGATRPNDVLRIRGGRTVEVVNTDAEGRLVLADGLVAAAEEKPTAIIDIATLTGAHVVALGHRYSAVMGDEPIVEAVRAAAADAGELVWPMPLPDELLARLDSDVADLKNATPGDTAAGMLLAGAFLREFVPVDGGIPWAHIDIAGTATNDGKPYGPFGAGATGVGVRTLLALAESHTDR